MQKIPKREYTVELKEQAVKRVKDGKSVGAVAKEMGLVELAEQFDIHPNQIQDWKKRLGARQK